MIYIENRKKTEKKLKEKYPNAVIADVTSKATNSLVKLSPFYPHGDIPIPFTNGHFAMSVEGIWQGLKVFESADVDPSMFQNATMKNIKRTVRKFGKPLGHRKGVKGEALLGYIEARIQIYLPAYLWVLENKVKHIVDKMKEASKEKDIVLLDYATNSDVLDSKKPLSHAFLIKAFIEEDYPTASKLETEIIFRKSDGQLMGKSTFTNQKKSKKSAVKGNSAASDNEIQKENLQTTLF